MVLKEVQKLLRKRKYEEIYLLYGSSFYVNNVPNSYMRKDIKQLLKKGLFKDIYNKYGPKIYNKYIPKMKTLDIKLETNKNVKYNIKK